VHPVTPNLTPRETVRWAPGGGNPENSGGRTAGLSQPPAGATARSIALVTVTRPGLLLDAVAGSPRGQEEHGGPGASGDVQLGERLREMTLHRLLADARLVPDLLVDAVDADTGEDRRSGPVRASRPSGLAS
jgi:hypothetical protein